eukprot:scpid110445/ scgid5314/ 
MVEQCVWSNEEPRCEQPQCRQQMHTVNSGAAECEEQPGDQVACEEPTKLSMDVTPELEDLPKSQPHHQALKCKSSSMRSLLRQIECATYNLVPKPGGCWENQSYKHTPPTQGHST